MFTHTAVRNEDWRRSGVFHIYITYGGKNYKLMIDGDSCANIIAKTALEKMGFKTELHIFFWWEGTPSSGYPVGPRPAYSGLVWICRKGRSN